MAGRLAWTRADVLSWLSETRGVSSQAETSVKISANPYPRNPARFLVTFELPTTDTVTARNRVRKVAPFGLDEAGAIQWGQSQLGEVLRENMGSDKKEDPQPTHQQPTKPGRHAIKLKSESTVPTMYDFWHDEFAVYLSQQAHSTQCAYESMWINYFEPVLGKLPLDAIGKQEIKRNRSAHSVSNAGVSLGIRMYLAREREQRGQKASSDMLL